MLSTPSADAPTVSAPGSARPGRAQFHRTNHARRGERPAHRAAVAAYDRARLPDELTRRTLIKRGLVAGGALAAGGVAVGELLGSKERDPKRRSVPAGPRPAPNILVVLVDQMRAPQWFQNGALAVGLMPNLARLRSDGVHFARHYTAANDCSPSRAVLLTGLHSQQTGCLVTSGSTLDPKFPTWGSILREHGYDDALVRQVAPHARRQQVDSGRSRGARAVRFLGRHVSLTRWRARTGLARRPARRSAVP